LTVETDRQFLNQFSFSVMQFVGQYQCDIFSLTGAYLFACTHLWILCLKFRQAQITSDAEVLNLHICSELLNGGHSVCPSHPTPSQITDTWGYFLFSSCDSFRCCCFKSWGHKWHERCIDSTVSPL